MTEEEMKAAIAKAEKEAADAKAEAERIAADSNAAKRIAARFEGMDPEAIKRAQELEKKYEGVNDETFQQFQRFQETLETEEDRKVYESGGLVALVSRQTTKMQENHAAKVAALEEQVAALTRDRDEAINARRNSSLATLVATAIASDDKLVSGVEDFVMFRMADYIKWDGDNPTFVDPNDELPMVSPADASKPMSVAEFVSTVLPKIAPVVLKPSAGGGGTGGNDEGVTDNPFLDKTRILDQANMRNKNPELAKKLAAAARAAGKSAMIAIAV